MKTMLSIPRTISRAARVRNAIQAWGSLIHSIIGLRKGAGGSRPRGRSYTKSAEEPGAERARARPRPVRAPAALAGNRHRGAASPPLRPRKSWILDGKRLAPGLLLQRAATPR